MIAFAYVKEKIDNSTQEKKKREILDGLVKASQTHCGEHRAGFRAGAAAAGAAASYKGWQVCCTRSVQVYIHVQMYVHVQISHCSSRCPSKSNQVQAWSKQTQAESRQVPDPPLGKNLEPRSRGRSTCAMTMIIAIIESIKCWVFFSCPAGASGTAAGELGAVGLGLC